MRKSIRTAIRPAAMVASLAVAALFSCSPRERLPGGTETVPPRLSALAVQASPSLAPQASPSLAPQASPSLAPQASPSLAPQASPIAASIKAFEFSESEVREERPLVQTGDWKTFASNDNQYIVQFPKEWEHERASDGIAFGTPGSKSGGYFFTIRSGDTGLLEDYIAGIGDQYSDRKVAKEFMRLADGKVGLMVTVSSASKPGWVYKTMFVQRNKKLYMICDGGSGRKEYSAFYRSFELIN